MKAKSTGISLGRFMLLWAFLTIGAMAVFSVFMSLKTAEDRIWDDADKLGQSTVSQVSLIAERSIERDQALLREFMVDSSLDYRVDIAAVADPEGVIAFGTQERLLGKTLVESGLVDARVMEELSGKGAFFGLRSRAEHGLVFVQSFVWPPGHGEIRSNKIGYAVVVLDLTEGLDVTRGEIMRDHLKVDAAFLAITSLVFVFLYVWLKTPLGDLTTASKRFRAGDSNFRIGKIRIRELGELSEAFEDMAEEIGSMFSRLKASEVQFKALIECSPIGIVAFDQDGQAAYVNQEFCRVSGIGLPTALAFSQTQLESALCDRGYRPVAHLDADLESEKLLGVSDRPDQTREIVELHLPEVRVLARIVEEFPAGRMNISCVNYFQDITSLTLLDRMKSEFMSTAAHELRTPMSIIAGYAELLHFCSDYTEEEKSAMVVAIREQAGSMTRLLDELLDLARIEAGAGKVFDFRDGSIGALLEDISDSFILNNDLRKVRLGPIPPLPDLSFDSAKIAQAIKNCLSNAYKFSARDTEVSLAVEPVQLHGLAAVAIRISDRGIGMTAEQLSHIFEKFYRADLSGNIPGTGLGMSLVKEIMEHHGGKVQVESQPGKGTTVSLFLPVPSGLDHSS